MGQSAIPKAALSYLSSAYPGYVFEKAYSATDASGLLGYAVLIDANNTKYVLAFDASGQWISSVVVR